MDCGFVNFVGLFFTIIGVIVVVVVVVVVVVLTLNRYFYPRHQQYPQSPS